MQIYTDIVIQIQRFGACRRTTSTGDLAIIEPYTGMCTQNVVRDILLRGGGAKPARITISQIPVNEANLTYYTCVAFKSGNPPGFIWKQLKEL